MTLVVYDERFAAEQIYHCPVKRCNKCREFKSKCSEFRKCHSAYDGLQTQCKKCQNRRATIRNMKKVKNNLHHKLKDRISSRIRQVMRQRKTTKSDHTAILVGCSMEQLKQHLQEQFSPEMSWQNYGRYWEIDHIRPCCSFDLTKVEEQKVCFHYSNLRPLTAPANRSKGGRWESTVAALTAPAR